MNKYIQNFLILLVFLINSNLVSTKIKILVKINNQIITNIDLEHRLNLALAVSGIPDENNVREQLRGQVLKVLIDESLKIQQAEKMGILINSSEVYQEINKLERNLNISKDTLIENFRKKSIPESVVYNQIRGQLLWNKIIAYTIANNISITDRQKDEALQNFIKNSGEAEYNISEIFISPTSEDAVVSSKEKALSIYSKANISNFLLYIVCNCDR